VHSVVLGFGHTPNAVMLIGEAPGETEAELGRPFCGPSGREQDAYLSRFGYYARQFYLTNLSKDYLPGNPDPTREQIACWAPTLAEEIRKCRPRLIATVGRLSTWEFLRTSHAAVPPPAFLVGLVHGIPHEPSPLSAHYALLTDPTLFPDGPPAILPVIHPAFGMRATEEAMAARSKIFFDYGQLAKCASLARAGKPIPIPRDEHRGREDYRVISAYELPDFLPRDLPARRFAMDTEGTPSNPFSVQVSCRPGTGYMLLCDEPEYREFAAPYLQMLLDDGWELCIHSRYEIEMSEAIGLDLSRANICDTQYLAYPLLVEMQGLKELSHRWLGMTMDSHEEVVRGVGTAAQVAYLEEVVRRGCLTMVDLGTLGPAPRAKKAEAPAGLKPKRAKGEPKPPKPPKPRSAAEWTVIRKAEAERVISVLSGVSLADAPTLCGAPTSSACKAVRIGQWPIPEPRPVFENDGTAHVYTPQPIAKTAASLLARFRAGAVEKDGSPLRLDRAWREIGDSYRGVAKELHEPVEDVLGTFPEGSIRRLYAADPKLAVHYSCSDADATIRWRLTADSLLADFHGRDLRQLCADGSALDTVIDAMQSRGMPVHIPSLRKVAAELEAGLAALGARISQEYSDGRPFNPNSSDDVVALMKRRGLSPGELTAGGEWSTAKKSIEGLRYKDPAMALVFDWREHEHTLSAFIWPVLDALPRGFGDDGNEFWRVKGKIKNTRTTSRRLSAEKPNPLAWPKHSRYGQMLRACCFTPPGRVLVLADYSAIEARGAAHKSGDPKLCEIFNRSPEKFAPYDRCVHYYTASQVFGVPTHEVDKKTQRSPSKRAFFGAIYGMQASGLHAQLQREKALADWTEDRCEELLRELWKIYRGLASYRDSVVAWARRDLVVFDDWGMPRYVPGVISRTPKIAAEAGRHAFSHVIQGWAQGVIQNAMRRLKTVVLDWQAEGKPVWWLLQEHDALDFECADEAAETVRDGVVDAMTRYHGVRDCRVPIEVEAKISRTWGAGED